MSRILVVYSTRAGTTAHVATILSKGLRAHDHEVTVASASTDPSPDGFDYFVVGSSIIANSWNGEAIAWLQQHRASIDGRTALFNVCLTAASPEHREEALALNSKAAGIVEPVVMETFAGRYEPQKVSWWRRLLMRAIQQPPQDHLDPAAITRWAAELSETFTDTSEEP